MNISPEVSQYMADLAKKSHKRFEGTSDEDRRAMTAKATYLSLAKRKGYAAADAWLEKHYTKKEAKWLLYSWGLTMRQPS